MVLLAHQKTRKGYEPKTAHGSAVRCPVFSVDSGREKRSLYSLAHLPSAGVQEEERASLFRDFHVSTRVFQCFQPDANFGSRLRDHSSSEELCVSHADMLVGQSTLLGGATDVMKEF